MIKKDAVDYEKEKYNFDEIKKRQNSKLMSYNFFFKKKPNDYQDKSDFSSTPNGKRRKQRRDE